MSLSDLLHIFLINQDVINNSSQTLLYYKKRISYFIDFVNNKNLKQLNIDDYNSYTIYLKNKVTKKGKNLSSATIKTNLNAVKIFIKFGYDNKYINSDFYKNIKPYKQLKKAIVVLSDKEIKKLLNTQNNFTLVGVRNLLVISLMLDCGLRVSEVVNLNFTDINIELGLIHVLGKGSKERLVPLTDSVIDYYKKYLFLSGILSGALFIDSDTGFRITTSGISQILRRIKKKYNFRELHPHFLRHTFATLFLVNRRRPCSSSINIGTFYSLYDRTVSSYFKSDDYAKTEKI